MYLQKSSPPYSIVYRKTFFPDAVKLAKIIPLYKEDSKFETTNYRPISLLPIISKIFERLIFNRLNDFLSKHKILSENQFGFQKNNHTVMTKITNAFENKEIAYSIFLDFAKAFVNHQILLSKLEHYGVEVNLFKSYLISGNSAQKLMPLYQISAIENTNGGVPQGSILGPLLFLIYINDIINFTSADDTTLFYSSKKNPDTEYILNTEIVTVSEWLNANRLSLNIKKSCFLTFSSSSV